MILGKYINDIQLLYLKLISMSSKLHFFAAEIIFSLNQYPLEAMYIQI